MVEKGYHKLILLGVAVAVFFIFDNWKHKFDRPWAYGDGPVLLGKWAGEFQDPKGISKQMELEILEPDEETIQSIDAPREYPESREFKGYAKITSKLGVEDDWIRGYLGNKDGHPIDRIDFMPNDEKKTIRESFNVSNTIPGGAWKDDLIQVKLNFTYRTKTGSAFWDSADPIYKKEVPLTLHRVK